MRGSSWTHWPTNGSYPLRRSLRLCLQADDRCAGEGVLALHIRRREQRLRAREANEDPAGEVLVAAVDRVSEHSFHGMCTHGSEERLRARPSEAGRLAFLERRDHGVLLRRIELHKWRIVGGAAIIVERRKPAPIEILLIGIGPREREIDVIEHARICGTGL